MKLTLLPYKLAVCRLEPSAEMPRWLNQTEFYTLTKTRDELSIVCSDHLAPDTIIAERNWRCFKAEGPFDFSLSGVLSGIILPLADAKISIFAFSTFDTDYVMVKENLLSQARKALEEAGYQIQ